MGKFFNSVTGQMEDDGQPGMDFTDMFSQPTGIPAQPQSSSKPVDPKVAAYLQTKMNIRQPQSEIEEMPELPQMAQPQAVNPMDQFSNDNYKKAVQRSRSEQDSIALSQLASGIGDALARRDPSSSDKFYSDLRSNIQDQNVGEFNRQKAAALADMSTKQKMDLMDPNSEKSKAFRSQVEAMMPNIAKSYGKNWGQVSAADGDSILNLGKFKEAQETRKQQMQMHQDYKRDQVDAKNLERQKERMTTFGEARTLDDAKKLKDASEMKTKFDRQLDELIALRESHGGGALLDRDDVGRAKQLSKDLLLTYKDMSKLGVLSQSDNEILNAIIPPDPLAYDFVPGQDPILHKMKKFKGDTQADFDTRLNNRLLNPVPSQPKQPVEQQKRKMPKTITQNGHTYTFNEATGTYE